METVLPNRIRVKVSAGTRKEKIEEVAPHTFNISVKEPREKGNANKRVRELLAEHYRVNYRDVVLATGHHLPRKTFYLCKLK